MRGDRVWMRIQLETDVILNQNRLLYMTADRQKRIARDLKNRGYLYARSHALPKGLQRLQIDAIFHFNRPGHRRDIANYMPTLKHLLDGMVMYGICPDDSDRYLRGPFAHAGKEKAPKGAVIIDIYITDLGQEGGGPHAA